MSTGEGCGRQKKRVEGCRGHTAAGDQQIADDDGGGQQTAAAWRVQSWMQNHVKLSASAILGAVDGDLDEVGDSRKLPIHSFPAASERW